MGKNDMESPKLVKKCDRKKIFQTEQDQED